MAVVTPNSAKIAIDIVGYEVFTANTMQAGVIPDKLAVMLDLANGLSDGQIDLIYAVSETGKAASTAFSYDLSGTLKDAFNRNVVLAEVCMIAIRNNRTDALAYLDIGPHATNGFGRLASSLGFWPADLAADADQGTIVAPGGGWVFLYSPAGVPVVAGTGDILRVTTSGVAGATNAWDLLVFGRSA